MVWTSLFVAVIAVFAFRAQAQDQNVPADVRAFAAQYVAAMNSKDPARLRAMYHSKSVACITPQTKAFYDEVTAMDFDEPIGAGYTVSLLPVNENNVKALSQSQVFPVKPLNELHIDSQQGEDGSTTIVWLARENGRLVGDFPCATEAALKQWRDEAPQRAEFQARYKAMAAGIQQPLRSQLIAMLREHNTSSAIDRYHAASGQDEQTSMLVINALKQQMETK
jgi:hypothetical protein